MRLNPENDLVRAVHAFIGSRVEEVRRSLFEKEKARKAEEDAKKLAKQAAEIAKVINEDFNAFRQRVAKVRAKTRGSSDLDQNSRTGGQEEDDLIFGTELPAQKTNLDAPLPAPPPPPVPPSPEPGPPSPEPPPNQVSAVGPAETQEPKLGRPSGGKGTMPKPAGGFRVEFKPVGVDSPRAQYVPDERTIYINLEHPQLAAARGQRPIDDPVFRRLAYEVAFSEYAIALAQELARRGEYLDPTDPIFDIRDTMNRIARKGAPLYVE
jgi:hypothetical protein